MHNETPFFFWAAFLALACGGSHLLAYLKPDANGVTRSINRYSSESHPFSVGSPRQRILAVVVVSLLGAVLFLTLGFTR